MSLLFGSAVDQVSAWVILLGLLGAGWFFFRGGGRTAINSLETANRVLAKRVDDQDRIIEAQARRILELEAKTDVSQATAAALAPLIEQTANYERRAEERHLLTMNILDLIAKRLGREPGLFELERGTT